MFNQKKFFILILLGLYSLTSSCGLASSKPSKSEDDDIIGSRPEESGNDESSSNSAEENNDKPLEEENKEETESDLLSVSELKPLMRDLLEGLDCEKNFDDPRCALMESTIVLPKLPNHYDEKVLLVDTDFGQLSHVGFRHRIEASYQFSNSKIEDISQKSIRIPYYIDQIAKLRTNAEMHSAFQVDMESFARNYAANWEGDNKIIKHVRGHGEMILSEIGLYCPRARFVLLKSFEPQDYKNPLCQQNPKKIYHWANVVAAQINKLIDKHEIKYINVSMGHTVESILDHYGKVCTGPKPSLQKARAMVEALSPIYKVYFDRKDVFAVQASFGNGDDKNNLVHEMTPYRSRILTGLFTTGDKTSPIDLEGLNGYVPGRKEEVYPNLSGPTDLYVNLGIEHGDEDIYNVTPALHSSGNDFRVRHIPDMLGTSWAAPIVLSWMMYVKNTEFSEEPYNRETFQKIKQSMSRGRFRDPLKFYQFEVYRLGLDSKE